MSNLFYDYLTERLTCHLKKNLRNGDRFFFQLDNIEELNSFYNYLKNLESSENFVYKHPLGSEYKSFTLNIPNSNCRLLIAATTEGITPDFLVLLRNCVAEEREEFKDTAILFLTHLPLDSLSGGSGNLTKDGMPFNIKNLAQHLEGDIRNSSLTKGEKEILNFYLNKKLEGLYDTPSLWDFEDILAILTLEKIEPSLFGKLELFPDEWLELYPLSRKELEIRIEENDRLFQKVRHALTYSEDDLFRFLDEDGAKKILALKEMDSWKTLDFSIIRDSEERFQDLKREKIEYLGAGSSHNIEIWEKREREKKVSIIIFNPDNLEEIPLTFEFDKKLNGDLVKLTPKSLEREVRRNRITLNLKLIPDSSNFFKFIYDFGRKTTINITVLNFHSYYLDAIKSCSYVRTIGQRKGEIIINLPDSEIHLGSPEKPVKNIFDLSDEERISFSQSALKIDSAESFQDEFTVTLKLDLGGELPLRFKSEVKRNFPWDGSQVFKQKRELEENFTFDIERGKISHSTSSYIIKNEFQEFLELESQLLKTTRDLDIDSNLKSAYSDIIQYFNEMEILPSLTAMDSYLVELYREFLILFNEEIETIEENRAIINQPLKRDLWNIGMVKHRDIWYLTPLHPLNMAYQLELYERAGNEPLSSTVLERLKGSSLLPFIERDGELYRVLDIKGVPEWKMLKKFQESCIGDAGGFLSRIVLDKLKDFFFHFRYLFPFGSRAPLKIKIIHLDKDFEITRGLIEFIIWEIRGMGLKNIVPLEISLHAEKYKSSELDNLSKFKNFEELTGYFNIDESITGVDEGDILRAIRDNIRYYQRDREFSYSHISFYKMMQKGESAKNLAREIPSSIGLGGLISGCSALAGTSDYRIGFGSREFSETHSQLLKTAKNLNELICNMDNGGKNSYQKDHVLVTSTSLNENLEMNRVLSSSFWVNFIEPNVNLDYFYRNNRDLAVIHYSDQYTSSTQYDSITVSSRTEQYQKLITQYLDSIPLLKNSDFHRENVSKELIRFFNSFNGEWLLRIVGDRGNLNFQREKLSIIAAIKNLLLSLERENMIWIPISLEEILRVAGSVGLRREDGMFSAKNLGSSGRHSDDLLLIGIEFSQVPKLHFYPVEVKIGNSISAVVKKAEEQILKTVQLLKENLTKESEDYNSFKNSFYRYFFIQLLLAASEKLAVNGVILTQDDIARIDSIKGALLRDEYLIDGSLENEIGAGGILLFERDTPYEKKIEMDYARNIMFYRFKESRAYTSIIQTLDEMRRENIS